MRAVHVVLCGYFIFVSNIASADVNTLVLVPEVQGSAQKIYDLIVEGVSSHPDLKITILQIDKETTAPWLETQINNYRAQLVIAIGNNAYRLSNRIHSSALIVAGGISGKPNGVPTLSLSSDPNTVLKNIHELLPEVKELRLVYNDQYNGWWYQSALKASKHYGISVIGYQASDLKHGVSLYEKLLADSNNETSAVWIPLKSIVPSKTILPLLLEQAWNKKLSVVSNNPAHTKLGGLLAMYPDHLAMGKQLAQFAFAHYTKKSTAKIIGTNELRLAINLRTSAHLGLNFNAKDRNQFDKVFPTAQ